MMKKSVLSCLFALMVVAQAAAQSDTTYWKKSFQVGANFNQASFSDNWKAGGVNSVAIGSFLNFKAEYAKEHSTWSNDLQLQYGILQNQGQSSRKNVDRIFFDTKYGYKFSPKWDFFGSLNLLTQFDLGYEYRKDATTGVEIPAKISGFMAPGFITQSIGVEYKPVSYFWIRFGTGTLRQTIVSDTTIYKNVPSNYGVEIGKTLRNEVAFQIVANFDKDVFENVNLKNRFMGFMNYETIGRIDIRWDIVLTAKVNKYINANLTTVLLYDDDQDVNLQYSQALALGFQYSLNK